MGDERNQIGWCIVEVYKYYKPSGHSFENLQKENVCFSHMDDFDDKMEGAFKTITKINIPSDENGSACRNMANAIIERYNEDASNLIRYKFRVLCVTDSMLNRYMWEKYADHGTGFCVVYDSADLEKCSDASGRINYKDIKDPNGIFEENNNIEGFHEEVKKILFSKVTNHGIKPYQLEKEIRYIISLPKTDCHIITINEFLNIDDENNKSKQFAAYCDWYARRFLKAPRRILKKVKPLKIIVGFKISENNLKRLKEIAETIDVPLIQIQENEIQD